MRVDMNKTKVVISGECQKAARWPCGACDRGFGSNSIQCTSLSKVMSFICRGCMNPVTGTGSHTYRYWSQCKSELVGKFCYLGDMLSLDGDADAAVETRI